MSTKFFFSLAAHHPREKVIRFLQSKPKVLWIGELAGRFSYGVTLLVKGPQEAAAFIQDFASVFGACFDSLSQAHVLSFTLLRKSYLCPGVIRSDKDKLTLEYPKSIVDIDELDWRILSKLHHPSIQSQRELSQHIRSSP